MFVNVNYLFFCISKNEDNILWFVSYMFVGLISLPHVFLFVGHTKRVDVLPQYDDSSQSYAKPRPYLIHIV